MYWIVESFRCGLTSSSKYRWSWMIPAMSSSRPAAFGDLDGQVGSFVQVNPAEEDELVARLLAERQVRQVDAVVDRRHVGQLRVAVGVADRDVVRVLVVPVDAEDVRLGESVDRREHRRRMNGVYVSGR